MYDRKNKSEESPLKKISQTIRLPFVPLMQLFQWLPCSCLLGSRVALVLHFAAYDQSSRVTPESRFRPVNMTRAKFSDGTEVIRTNLRKCSSSCISLPSKPGVPFGGNHHQPFPFPRRLSLSIDPLHPFCRKLYIRKENDCRYAALRFVARGRDLMHSDFLIALPEDASVLAKWKAESWRITKE